MKKVVFLMNKKVKISGLILLIVIGAIGVFHWYIGPYLVDNVISTGNHTLLVMGADPTETRPGPGACDMAFIAEVNHSSITNVTPLYPGGMANPTASPPATAAAQGDTKLYLHDTLWWNNTTMDAQLAQQTVQYNTGIKTDGVIIIRTYALDAIVQAIGPINVPGEGTIPDNDSLGFIREEQQNGSTRGAAVLAVGDAIKSALHNPTKQVKLAEVISDQYSKGNIIVVPSSLYNQLFSEEILNKIFS